MSGKLKDKIIAHIPMRRFGKPEDLLGTMLWLVDDTAGFMAYSGV